MSEHQNFNRIRIIMVNTSHPGNIGGAARAMKNMGLSQLYLVEPKEYPAEKAVWRAASALDVLDKAVVVDTLDEAIADCSLVIGTSARERRIPWPMLTPRECGERSWVESQSADIAIVFGREDRGLTNDELQKCHYHVHIPSNPDYSSLNIAAAIQVLCYEIRMAHLTEKEGKAISYDDWDVPRAKSQDLEYFYNHFEEALCKLEFIEADNPRQTMTRLRRLFNRIRMDEMELSIMRGILTSIQNYIRRVEKRIEQSKK